MSLARRLLLLLLALSAFGLALLAVGSQQLTRHWVENNLLESAERIYAVLMSTRRVYHHQFIDSGVPLTDKTLGFLPAHAMHRISEEIRDWDRTGFSFNNVSDRPRNPLNQADAVEMEAIADFRAHPDRELRFVPFTDASGQPYYHYARPIRVEKYCLQCHGDREPAPATIRERYADAYGYAEGDLRGILSIKVPAAPLQAQARKSFRLLLGVGILVLGLLAGGIGWSVRRLVVRPLAALELHIQAVAAGDLAQRAGKLPGEFGRVGQAFNAMTERLEHEHGRRLESEGRFEATFEQAAVGIALVSPEGRWLRVNRRLCAIVGYTPEELLAKTFQDITHPDDLDADLGQVRRMLAREIDTYSMEKRYYRKDGGIVWINLTVSLAWKADSAPDYFISVVEDISARKQTEAALREREHRLEAIVGHSPSALSLKHPDGRYALANPNVQRIHHLSEAQIVDKTDFDLYPEESARVFRANDRRVLDTMARHAIEEVVPVDGVPRNFMSHMFPVLDDAGRAEYVCRIALDVTDRKQAEEELKRRLEELERFNQGSIDRELRMVGLKRQVNDLTIELGRAPPYDLSFAETPPVE